MDPQNDRLPQYFNAAEKWPGKIHEPLDQGNCAASWAFSTAGETQIASKILAEYWQNASKDRQNIDKVLVKYWQKAGKMLVEYW